MGFVVRKANTQDAILRAAIEVLLSQVFSASEWVGGRLPVCHEGEDWWIAWDGKVPAAVAGMVPSVRTPQTGYMCAAGVLPQYRGQGLQSRLVDKRVEQARRNGWKAVITDTILTNVASMRSLIRCGFRPYAPEVRWGSPDHAVYWRLDL